MKKWMKYLSEVLCGGCAGIIIDFITAQSATFTLLGLAAGAVLAIVHIIKDKRRETK